MSSSSIVALSFSDVLSSIAVILIPVFGWMIGYRPNRLYALSIPVAGGKSYLVKNLDFSNSTDYSNLIDMDIKVSNNSHSDLDSDIFTKAKKNLDGCLEIMKQTSRQNKMPIISSRNYKLLKYLQPKQVYYFLGSSSYYSSINLSVEDNRGLQEYRDFLNSNKKMDKVISYNSKEELISKICEIFKLNVKK